MALVNHVTREINAKIVYYGPERAGKGTSLRYLHDRIRPSLRSELKSVPASGSSLLFFDFAPFEQPVLGGYRIRFHLCTLQGPVANPAAWKMTLKGADGLVIVMDATPGRSQAAQQSLAQLRDYLGSYGLGLDDIPAVLQFNKSDLSGRMVAEAAARGLGVNGCRAFPANALTGEGVLEVVSALSPLIMRRIGERDDLPRQRSFVREATDAAPVNDAAGEVDAGSGGDAPPEFDQCQAAVAVDDLAGGVGQVVVSPGGVRVEGGAVVIPLDISSSQGIQRLTVTVMVASA